MPSDCSAKNAQSAAEADKAAAEAAKTAAESAKATAEAAAATAESAKAQADQDKATAESALAAAESAGAQAEVAKSTAEFAAGAAETAKAQALQEKATAEAAKAQAETAAQLAKQEAASTKKSYANEKADWKAVAGAKQQAEEARHTKKLVEQLQKDLKQVPYVCRCGMILTCMLPTCEVDQVDVETGPVIQALQGINSLVCSLPPWLYCLDLLIHWLAADLLLGHAILPRPNHIKRQEKLEVQ